MRFELSPEELRPVVQAVVAESLATLTAATEPLQANRLACSKREAARHLGVKPHV